MISWASRFSVVLAVAEARPSAMSMAPWWCGSSCGEVPVGVAGEGTCIAPCICAVAPFISESKAVNAVGILLNSGFCSTVRAAGASASSRRA